MNDSTGRISYITHDAPAWRPTGNGYIAMVDLAPFGFENEQEQVWLRSLGGEEFEVCCIPFQIYGVSLGDRVKLSDGRFVSGVLSRSGRKVFRVFFTDPRPPINVPDSRDALRSAIAAGRFLSEWSGDRHVAIDVPESCDPVQLFEAIEGEVINETAYCEWGDSEPFGLSG
ncbi:DUF4265 domain-containing protein [Streptomyces sp. GD-15H]|uniref:DUF4265 domain-containing protein n=1 Tax=Streptomyces sp. GD-15H TaxID=3129112 RepID=UPI0032444E92